MEYSHPKQNLPYRVSGEGAPIVFIHGFGEDSSVFDEITLPLVNNYKVYIIDLPGVNGAPFNKELSFWNIDDYATLIHDFINDVIKEKVTIFGHSMGGYISLSLASQYPEDLLGFGLIHSTALADSEEKVEAREKNIEFIEKYGSALFIKTTTPNLYAPDSQEKFASEIAEHIEKNASISNEALIAYTRAMIRREDKTLLLKKTQLPVLWIIGKHDQAVKFDDTLKQVYLPNISFVNILNESGHMGMIEEPERVVNGIKEFLYYIYRRK